MEKPKKKRAGKIILIIIICIISVILLFSAASFFMNRSATKKCMELATSFEKIDNPNAIIPELKDNNWTFTTDRELKIVQLTDIHLGGGWMSKDEDAKALTAVASMLTVEKPDLVIVTGDISFPVPFISGTLNNMNSAKIFAELMETLGIYWIPTFGNHDTEAYSFYSREDISKFYANDEFKYCIFEEDSDEIDGYGNGIINVKNTEGAITHAIYTVDSHSYTDGDYLGIFWKYDKIHDNQVEWYKNTVKEIDESNKKLLGDSFKPVTTLTFMHIPPIEMKTAAYEYIDNGMNDTDDVKQAYGVIGEKDNAICTSIHEDKFVEAMQEHDGKTAIFCGHDHLNTMSLTYKGVQLTYGYSIDYLAYSGIDEQYSQRGCTVITLKPDGSFENIGENYYQHKYSPPNGIILEEEVSLVQE